MKDILTIFFLKTSVMQKDIYQVLNHTKSSDYFIFDFLSIGLWFISTTGEVILKSSV